MAKRLIDAYLLKRNICSNTGSKILGHSIVRKFRLDELIDAQPTVDAVEVVRCRDCKLEATCKHTQRLGEDGFCSNGERKEK